MGESLAGGDAISRCAGGRRNGRGLHLEKLQQKAGHRPQRHAEANRRNASSSLLARFTISYPCCHARNVIGSRSFVRGQISLANVVLIPRHLHEMRAADEIHSSVMTAQLSRQYVLLNVAAQIIAEALQPHHERG